MVPILVPVKKTLKEWKGISGCKIRVVGKSFEITRNKHSPSIMSNHTRAGVDDLKNVSTTQQ